jgi:hypothetical protein
MEMLQAVVRRTGVKAIRIFWDNKNWFITYIDGLGVVNSQGQAVELSENTRVKIQAILNGKCKETLHVIEENRETMNCMFIEEKKETWFCQETGEFYNSYEECPGTAILLD